MYLCHQVSNVWLERIRGGRIAEEAEQVKEATLEVEFGVGVGEEVHVHLVHIWVAGLFAHGLYERGLCQQRDQEGFVFQAGALGSPELFEETPAFVQSWNLKVLIKDRDREAI